jgi:DinB family protein
MTINWNAELLTQLESHWDNQLRPRLDGLTDEEYFWEPVPGCWSIHRRGESTAPLSVGGGDLTMDYAIPQPDPTPVTTIAWRLAHIVVGIFGQRNAAHFGGPPADYRTFEYAGTAAAALRQLDEGYAAWVKGVRSLDDAGLARPCGPAEDPFGDSPMAGLVLHMNREVIHHGAEIALLRDLYLRKDS